MEKSNLTEEWLNINKRWDDDCRGNVKATGQKGSKKREFKEIQMGINEFYTELENDNS